MPGAAPSLADQLAVHLRAGTRLDLLPATPIGSAAIDADVVAGWGAGHVLDADVLRDLLRGRGVADPDPHGIRLRGARIRGRLDLALLSTTISLELADCSVEDGIDAGDGRLAGLRLHRCRLGSDGVRPAFAGDGLRVETLVSFASSVVTADHDDGAIRLGGARLGGPLVLSGAALRNDRGPSLVADRIAVAGALRLDGLTATGAVRLTDAVIDGHLQCPAMTVVDPTGPALVLDRTTVGGNLYLNRGAAVDGAGPGGAVRLLGTRIAGRLQCGSATVRNPSGPAIVGDDLAVGGDAELGDELTLDGAGPRCTLRLPGARVGGRLNVVGGTVTSRSQPSERWLVDGLTYGRAPLLDPAGHHRAAWLDLLRDATPEYRSQPYQQLAAVHRADGHDGDVRAILMRQRHDQLRRGALDRRADRLWTRLTGVLLGYGYQPWRSLLGLAGVLAVSVVLALVLGGQGGLDRAADPPGTTSTGTGSAAGVPVPRTSCTAVQTVGAGLDLGTPFLPASRSGSGSCETTATAPGEVLTVARWVLQLAAWALAALFVTGFTGIVRRT